MDADTPSQGVNIPRLSTVDLIASDGELSVEIQNETDGMVRIVLKATAADVVPGKLSQILEAFGCAASGEGLIESPRLSLPIARRLLDLMDAIVVTRSESDRDISLAICLPAALKNDNDMSKSHDGGNQRDETTRGGRDATLLYVEDNQANRLLLLQIVAKLPGITLMLAETGISGVDLFKKYRPDLVILDISLPDIDGYEVLHRIRNNEGGSVPIMALSANATESDISKGYRAGFDEYLTKPVEVPRLVAAIDRALKRKDGG